ncbi:MULTISPECIES: hypothetical protein [Clostridia]|uniref:hypothetical protein n=1 Tax=Clostridia TaxID=186801 RepID=UPI00067EB698|nr:MULTISPECIES: hypothetical protein [Clostridia]
MNTNIMNQKGYYVNVKSSETDGIYWGFSAREEHGNVFTIELAKELLALANAEYKKGCPAGYDKSAYNPDKAFTHIRYDMSNYKDAGDGHMVLVGDEKVGTYNSENNLLRIFKNGDPVYENNNGAICRDTVAMLDD